MIFNVYNLAARIEVIEESCHRGVWQSFMSSPVGKAAPPNPRRCQKNQKNVNGDDAETSRSGNADCRQNSSCNRCSWFIFVGASEIATVRHSSRSRSLHRPPTLLHLRMFEEALKANERSIHFAHVCSSNEHVNKM